MKFEIRNERVLKLIFLANTNFELTLDIALLSINKLTQTMASSELVPWNLPINLLKKMIF